MKLSRKVFSIEIGTTSATVE